MNWILKIAPKQLSQIDIYLRENYPWLWATRIHFTLYISILLAIFSGVIGLLAPVDIHDPLSRNDVMDYFGIFMFPAVLFGGYVVFQLCLFSVEKRNGKGSFFRPLIVFPTLMLSMILPILMPFTIAAVVNQKVAHLASEEVVEQELINMTKAQYFVNEGEGKYEHFLSKSDYLLYWKDLYDGESTTSPKSHRNNERVDQIYWHKYKYKNQRPRLLKGGSNYYSYYSSQEYTDLKNKIRKEFYHQQNLNFSLDTADLYLNLLRENQKKYGQGPLIDVEIVLDELKNNIYSDCYSNSNSTENNYNRYRNQPVKKALDTVERNLQKIRYAQHNFWNKNAEEILLVTLFVSFIITLILFIFKHVHWKQFLLSLLILAIYFTIAGIIEGFGRYRGDFIFTMLLALVFTSLLFVHRAWFLKRSSVLTNQMAIIAFCSLPFLPLMLMGYMDEVLDYWPYYGSKYGMSGYDYDGLYESYYDMKDRLYLTSFWIGIGIFYIIGLPYLKNVFLRLMSLPKSK